MFGVVLSRFRLGLGLLKHPRLGLIEKVLRADKQLWIPKDKVTIRRRIQYPCSNQLIVFCCGECFLDFVVVVLFFVFVDIFVCVLFDFDFVVVVALVYTNVYHYMMIYA